MENRKTKIINPITGKYYHWKIEPETVFSGYYNIGVERLHDIVRNLLLKKSYRRGSVMSGSSPNTLAKLFKLYDTDGSGSLDRDEFLQMLVDLGVQGITRKDYYDLFRLYDLDGDEAISYQEWAQAYCSHFSSDSGLLDLPSTRLDIYHVNMSPNEAVTKVIGEIHRVLKKTNYTLPQLVGWSYFGTKNTDHMKISEVKKTLRGHFNIGIGNEPALDLLLARCLVNKKYLSLPTLQKYFNIPRESRTDKHMTPISPTYLNKKKLIDLLTPRRPMTARPSRSRITPLEM